MPSDLAQVLVELIAEPPPPNDIVQQTGRAGKTRNLGKP
jgi:hypothetical protein